MIPCYTWRGICCADLGGRLPEGAVPTSTPFDPLVLLVHRDPLHSRGIYAVTTPAEVLEPEGPGLLLPPPTGCLDPDLDPVILAHGATVLNTAFDRCFEILERFLHPKTMGLRLTVAGLGDVGGTVLTGLTLLGAVRELLGTGKIFGLTIYPEDYGMLTFVLAPGAFIALGYLIAIVNRLREA